MKRLLPVGAVHQHERHRCSAEVWPDHRNAGALPRLQAAHAQPHYICRGDVCSASRSGLFYTWRLNSWGLQRDSKAPDTTPLLDQEARKHQRTRNRRLLAHHDRRRHLLGDVDGRDLVLLGLRPAVPGRPGLLGAGALDHASICALEGRALQDDPAHRPSSTTWASSPSPS